jgi:hypothetical protein
MAGAHFSYQSYEQLFLYIDNMSEKLVIEPHVHAALD